MESKQYYNEVRKNYVKQLDESCKELIKMTGVDVSGVDPDNVHEQKRIFKAKGYELQQAQVGSGLKTLVLLRFKGEFIAGYMLAFDPIMNVIKRTLIEDEKSLKKTLQSSTV